MKLKSWKELKTVIRSLPIEDVVLIRKEALDIKKKGGQLFGLCPFHNDNRQGNFAFGGPHNGYKCFACGEGGDIINLIMQLDEVSFKEALTTIAVEMELMSKEDAESFLNQGSPVTIQQKYRSQSFSSEPFAQLNERDVEYRNAVYSLLAEGEAIVNPVKDHFGYDSDRERLSEEHYRQLTEERHLTDEQIEEAGFFTMNADYKGLAALYYRLFAEKGYEPNALQVPGFWRHEKGQVIQHIKQADGTVFDFELHGFDTQYFWFCDFIDALGIPVRNENGNIVGIQLRPDKPGSGGKYVWLSSAHADGKKGKVGGTSPGAQQDVTLPHSWDTSYLFVTEGKFKSLALTDTFKVPSISLQGVRASKGLGDRVKNMDEEHVKNIEHVFVAFDADLSFNDAVLESTLDIAEKELSDYNVYIAVWDYKFGKGADDLIHNGHQEAMTRLTIKEAQDLKAKLNKAHPVPKEATPAEKDKIKAEREDYFYTCMHKLKPEMPLHPTRKLKA